MLQVKRIGHATLTTPDLERQIDYYTRVVGLSIVAREKNRAISATKPGQEAIVLEHGDRPAGMRLVVSGRARKRPRRAVGTRCRRPGIKMRERSDITPGIAAGDRVRRSQRAPASRSSPITRSPRTTAPTPASCRCKLGHVAYHTPDVAGTVKFYCDVLGFKVSDWRGDFFAFLRCSRDHHTINFCTPTTRSIHHIAFEVRDWPRSTAPATSRPQQHQAGLGAGPPHHRP